MSPDSSAQSLDPRGNQPSGLFPRLFGLCGNPCGTASAKIAIVGGAYRIAVRLLNSSFAEDLEFVRDWKKVIPSSRNFLQPDYLTVLGQGNPDAGLAVIVYDKEGAVPAAAFTFQVTELPGSLLQHYVPGPGDPTGDAVYPNGFFKRYLGSWIRAGLRRFSFRLLVSGNVFASSEPGYLFTEHVSVPDRGKVLREVYAQASSVLQSALKKNIQLWLISSDRSRPEIEVPDYHVIEAEPEMILTCKPEWNCFEDYQASMTSKYRVWTKKVFKTAAPLSCHMLSPNEIEQHGDLLIKLYLNVASRADFNMAWLDDGYFSRMKHTFGDRFSVHVWKTAEGQIIGFHTSILSGDVMDAHFLGMDYSQSNQYRLYPRILFELVDKGICAGATKIRFGKTASESKSIVGAKPYDTSYAIRHRTPLFHRILGPFLNALESPEWTERDPFAKKAVQKKAGKQKDRV